MYAYENMPFGNMSILKALICCASTQSHQDHHCLFTELLDTAENSNIQDRPWSDYGKCPKISKTLFIHVLFWPKFSFLCIFLKIHRGMVNSVDPEQTALIWICTVSICHFVRNFGVPNVRTFTVKTLTGWYGPVLFAQEAALVIPACPFLVLW